MILSLGESNYLLATEEYKRVRTVHKSHTLSIESSTVRYRRGTPYCPQNIKSNKNRLIPWNRSIIEIEHLSN